MIPKFDEASFQLYIRALVERSLLLYGNGKLVCNKIIRGKIIPNVGFSCSQNMEVYRELP